MRFVLAALSRPITVIVALIAIALFAFFAVRRMPVDIFPKVGEPAIYVAQPFGGMDPAQMEGYLTYYYEYHFLYITGISRVESKSIQGAALMRLVFTEGTDMSQAMAETVGYVNRARSFMPPGTVPPFITRFDAGSVAVGELVFSSSSRTQGELQSYLKISAPFSGVVTDRLVHPGALVGPGNDIVLLVVQQLSHLRLVVPVPEESVSGIVNGARVSFHVPAWPNRSFSGKVARISQALDQKTRTMPVELDVINADGLLSPGMFPSVKWPVHRPGASLFVPKTSVVTTTERTFVVRDHNGHAEWVEVKKGLTEGEMIEVIGELKPGDMVLRRATDEIREGMPLQGKR
jgi:hypothetical protein